MSRRLQILSASFTSFASSLIVAACSTCRRLRSAFGSDLSSVTSSTIAAIAGPNAPRELGGRGLRVFHRVVQQRGGEHVRVGHLALADEHVRERDRMVDVGGRRRVLAPLVAVLVRRERERLQDERQVRRVAQAAPSRLRFAWYAWRCA